MEYHISAAVVLVLSILSDIYAENFYVSVPNILRLNTDETISVILDDDRGASVKVYLQDYPGRTNRISEVLLDLKPGETKTFNFHLNPEEFPSRFLTAPGPKLVSFNADFRNIHKEILIPVSMTSQSPLQTHKPNHATKQRHEFQCGLDMENLRIGSHQTIIDEDKRVGRWPWMAALYMTESSNNRAKKLMCGGTIIHRNFILTTASCMIKRDKKDVTVKLGLTDVKNETYVREYGVINIFSHPDFHMGSTMDNDIALLQLDRPIEYNFFIRPVCLPPAALSKNSPLYRPGELAWATGWGEEAPLSAGKWRSSTTLKDIVVLIQSRERCTQSLLDKKFKASSFTDRMLCAGDEEGGRDACSGDGGGPLMQSQLSPNGDRYWTQVGIVSWGIGCGVANTFGYYTHVHNLRQWIGKTIQEAQGLKGKLVGKSVGQARRRA